MGGGEPGNGEQRALLNGVTVVWENFTVGYFRVKIVRGKIFSSLGVFNKKILTTNYF